MKIPDVLEASTSVLERAARQLVYWELCGDEAPPWSERRAWLAGFFADPDAPLDAAKAAQWGPGSPAAVDRGCSCDPGVVTTFGSRAEAHPVAFDAADVWCPPIVDPACPIHRPGAS